MKTIEIKHAAWGWSRCIRHYQPTNICEDFLLQELYVYENDLREYSEVFLNGERLRLHWDKNTVEYQHHAEPFIRNPDKGWVCLNIYKTHEDATLLVGSQLLKHYFGAPPKIKLSPLVSFNWNNKSLTATKDIDLYWQFRFYGGGLIEKKSSLKSNQTMAIPVGNEEYIGLCVNPAGMHDEDKISAIEFEEKHLLMGEIGWFSGRILIHGPSKNIYWPPAGNKVACKSCIAVFKDPVEKSMIEEIIEQIKPHHVQWVDLKEDSPFLLLFNKNQLGNKLEDKLENKFKKQFEWKSIEQDLKEAAEQGYTGGRVEADKSLLRYGWGFSIGGGIGAQRRSGRRMLTGTLCASCRHQERCNIFLPNDIAIINSGGNPADLIINNHCVLAKKWDYL